MKSDLDHWTSIKHTVFWDRDVSLDAWREGFLTGHRSYFPHSILWMHPRDGAKLLGREQFLTLWPKVRIFADHYPEVSRRIKIWDAAWSKAVSGAYSVLPKPEWSTLPRRAKDFLIYVAQHPGQSIYAVAKGSGSTYKRAYEHAKTLTSLGFLAQVEERGGPRRKKLLFARG